MHYTIRRCTIWIFTEHGFLSVVAYDTSRDRDMNERTKALVDTGADLLLARTRDEGDMQRLQALLPQVEYTRTDNADYRYRTVLTKPEWLDFISQVTDTLDYANFKDRVTEALGRDRHDLLMRVWSTMRELQRV